MAYTPKKISEFDAIITLVGNELIPAVQAGANKYTTPDQIIALFSDAAIAPASNTADYIPQWNGTDTKTLKDGVAVPAGGLAGLTALGNKLESSAFSDAGVTGKLITGYISGAGTVVATDTILQALNKLNGNISGLNYEVPLTFGSGLTRTVNAIANDLITGKAGGQTAYGGLAQTEALTLMGNITTATGTNIAGGDIYIKATPGTGTGASSLHFFTGTTLTTGSTLQTSSEKVTILGNGNVGIGTTGPNTKLSVNGIISILDGGTQSVNAGIVSEVNGQVLEFGVNEGSSNIFGGAYNSALAGGLFRFDSRISTGLLQIYGRAAGTAGLSSQLMSFNAGGDVTIGTLAGSRLTIKNSANGIPLDLYTNSTHHAFQFYGDNTAHGSLFYMYDKGGTTITNRLVGDSTAGLSTYFNTGNVGIGLTSPTAVLHLKAGTATASTAPLKFTTGVALTTAEIGAVGFTDPDFYISITDTTVKRKFFILNDGTNLTSGKIPIASTNGRLIDGQTPLEGTKVYYVSDTSGGAVTRKLTFISGILVSET